MEKIKVKGRKMYMRGDGIYKNRFGKMVGRVYPDSYGRSWAYMHDGDGYYEMLPDNRPLPCQSSLSMYLDCENVYAIKSLDEAKMANKLPFISYRGTSIGYAEPMLKLIGSLHNPTICGVKYEIEREEIYIYFPQSSLFRNTPLGIKWSNGKVDHMWKTEFVSTYGDEDGRLYGDAEALYRLASWGEVLPHDALDPKWVERFVRTYRPALGAEGCRWFAHSPGGQLSETIASSLRAYGNISEPVIVY